MNLSKDAPGSELKALSEQDRLDASLLPAIEGLEYGDKELQVLQRLDDWGDRGAVFGESLHQLQLLAMSRAMLSDGPVLILTDRNSHRDWLGLIHDLEPDESVYQEGLTRKSEKDTTSNDIESCKYIVTSLESAYKTDILSKIKPSRMIMNSYNATITGGKYDYLKGIVKEVTGSMILATVAHVYNNRTKLENLILSTINDMFWFEDRLLDKLMRPDTSLSQYLFSKDYKVRPLCEQVAPFGGSLELVSENITDYREVIIRPKNKPSDLNRREYAEFEAKIKKKNGTNSSDIASIIIEGKKSDLVDSLHNRLWSKIKSASFNSDMASRGPAGRTLVLAENNNLRRVLDLTNQMASELYNKNRVKDLNMSANRERTILDFVSKDPSDFVGSSFEYLIVSVSDLEDIRLLEAANQMVILDWVTAAPIHSELVELCNLFDIHRVYHTINGAFEQSVRDKILIQ